MQEVRSQLAFQPSYSWLVRLSNVVDVWDELVVATNPDQRVGRRGSQLSVCTRIFGSVPRDPANNDLSTAEGTGGKAPRHPSRIHPTIQVRVPAMEGICIVQRPIYSCNQLLCPISSYHRPSHHTHAVLYLPVSLHWNRPHRPTSSSPHPSDGY